jgi:hypothetical protein
MEDAMGKPPGWGAHFRAFMMSAPEDADLLKAASWTCSERLGRDPKWLDGAFGGWLEGNAVVTPDGGIVDILRADTKKPFEKVALIRIGAAGRTAAFDPARDFVDFPGGAKKFTIRFDPVSHHYWTLSSPMLPFHPAARPGGVRNAVALMRSKDLRRWETRTILLYHPDTKKHGFNYPDWLFDGEDLVAVIRTAYDDGVGGAHNFHDANYMTFHRFREFRDLTMEDADPRYRERLKNK